MRKYITQGQGRHAASPSFLRVTSPRLKAAARRNHSTLRINVQQATTLIPLEAECLSQKHQQSLSFWRDLLFPVGFPLSFPRLKPALTNKSNDSCRWGWVFWSKEKYPRCSRLRVTVILILLKSYGKHQIPSMGLCKGVGQEVNK